MALKLISLNIERCKHLHLNIPFFEKEKPDILCLQEVLEEDFKWIKDNLGFKDGFFVPQVVKCLTCSRSGKCETSGIAILSVYPFITHKFEYYWKPNEELLEENLTNKRSTNAQAVLYATVNDGEKDYTFANTHFTWTEGGHANVDQQMDFENLFKILEPLKEYVLCGDFNAPRGKEIFSLFASKLKDNIPLNYHSSIDGKLHRAGDIPFMIDGLFTTPFYKAENVKLVSGVSDHLAIVGDISKI